MSDSKTMEPMFAKVERLGAELIAALQECEAAGGWVDTHAVANVKSASNMSRARSQLAESERPKGPMVTIMYPGSFRDDKATASTSELAEVTSGALIMRTGYKFSRKTGMKINHTDRWRSAPYITREEIARIVALKWKPPASAKPTP